MLHNAAQKDTLSFPFTVEKKMTLNIILIAELEFSSKILPNVASNDQNKVLKSVELSESSKIGKLVMDEILGHSGYAVIKEYTA